MSKWQGKKVAVLHGGLSTEREDVPGAGAAQVHDEVRVDVRPRGVSDTVTLQAHRLDEPAGVVAGRVGEGRAERRPVERLRAAPLLLVLAHRRAAGLHVPGA